MLALELAVHRRPIGLGTAAMARLLAGVRVKQGAKLGVADDLYDIPGLTAAMLVAMTRPQSKRAVPRCEAKAEKGKK